MAWLAPPDDRGEQRSEEAVERVARAPHEDPAVAPVDGPQLGRRAAHHTL